MKGLFKKFTVVFALLGVAACSGGDGASEDDIQKALTMELPSGLAVADIEKQVSENVGDKIEPLWRARSHVEITFTEDFYKRVSQAGDVAVVKPTAQKGDTLSGSLITRSKPNGQNGWDVRIEKLDIANISGAPETRFGVNGFVLDGSDDHKSLLEKIKKQKEEEAERQRIAAEKAEAARKAKIAETREAMNGTWSADSPLLYEGTIWSNRSARKIAFEVKIPEGTEPFGEGSLVMYDYDSPWVQTTVPMVFKVADDATGLVINVTQSTEFKPVGFILYQQRDITLSSKGVLQFRKSTYRGGEYKSQLNKGKNEERLELVKRYNDLLKKHNPILAEPRMENLPLQNNTYSLFIVKANKRGKVYGTDRYERDSSVATSAVHAGLLKDQEVGVLKIIRREVDRCFGNGGTTKNGVTSETERTCHRAYEMELVEKM